MKLGLIFVGCLLYMSGLHAADFEQNIRDGLARLVPDVEVDSIKPTPIEGIYQVILGPDVIYMSGDGNYVLKGDLLDVSHRRNLTEDVRSDSRVAILESIDANEYIEFAADTEGDTIYVFTDIDCGYCRKLHMDIPELNKRGLTVRYLAYPRAGVNSDTGRQMASVWCSDNKQEALTRAKNNEPVEEKTCNDPVAKQYEMGKKIGVRGTPAIYLSDGQAIPGYMPPDRLIDTINR